MGIENLLNELGKYYHLTDLWLDPNRGCRILFDSGTAISLEADSEASYYHIYSVVGAVPVKNRTVFYEWMMDKNLYGAATGRATLFCDLNFDEIILWGTFDPHQINPNNFLALYIDFVDRAEHLTRQVAEMLRNSHTLQLDKHRLLCDAESQANTGSLQFMKV